MPTESRARGRDPQTAAHLKRVAEINDRLLKLEKTKGYTKSMIRRTQDELRQFSRWLADCNRHLDSDPLAAWRPIKLKRSKAPCRRALYPEDVARALVAADRLDELHGREHRQSPLFLAALVTGARPGALASRDAGDLDVSAGRVQLGEDVGKKRRGVAALDATTLGELVAFRGERKRGPLFPSPDGEPLEEKRVLARWRESYSLAIVDALWPSNEPRDLTLAHLVSLALVSGRVRVSRGGNPKRMRPETLVARSDLERRVAALVELLGPEWRRRTENVDLYSLRMTHRTWAEFKGVKVPAIDRQLGHSSAATTNGTDEFARALAGSDTGRRFYLDRQSELFDPRESAIAVRALLDEALASLTPRTSALGYGPPEPRGPRGGPQEGDAGATLATAKIPSLALPGTSNV